MGVSKDVVQALEWYHKVTKTGDTRNRIKAQVNIGLIYFQGEGVERDEAIAADWFTKAALNGDKSSAYMLGLMYKNGIGVEQSNAEAIKWWREAAKKGDNLAIERLKEMGETW